MASWREVRRSPWRGRATSSRKARFTAGRCSLRGAWGWSLFGVSWGLALFGLVQELTLGRRTRVLSLVFYVVMGWLALVAIVPLVRVLSPAALAWLVAGGLFYSVGIYWFIHDEKIRHGHGIWHLFVLAGSVCQFVCVYKYAAL